MKTKYRRLININETNISAILIKFEQMQSDIYYSRILIKIGVIK